MPTLALAAVCADCIVDAENNLTIVRQMGSIAIPSERFTRESAKSVLLVPPLFAVFVLRWDGPPNDNVQELHAIVQVVTPGGHVEASAAGPIATPESLAELEGGVEPGYSRLMIQIRSLPLDKPGTYRIRLLSGSQIIGEIPLFLRAEGSKEVTPPFTAPTTNPRSGSTRPKAARKPSRR